jgi:cytoskeletal protein RodZ
MNLRSLILILTVLVAIAVVDSKKCKPKSTSPANPLESPPSYEEPPHNGNHKTTTTSEAAETETSQTKAEDEPKTTETKTTKTEDAPKTTETETTKTEDKPKTTETKTDEKPAETPAPDKPGNSTSSTGGGSGGDTEFKTIGSSMDGITTRYWDCCKPSYAWPGSVEG